jgi:hypothetical protein
MRVRFWFALAAGFLSSLALGGENSNKPVNPEKMLSKYAFEVCERTGGHMDHIACEYRQRDFMKANAVPCAAKDIAAYQLKLTEALCMEREKKHPEKFNERWGEWCWKNAVDLITGKKLAPIVVGQAYDLSKLSEAVAYIAGSCAHSTKYLLGKDLDVKPACMSEKTAELQTAFALQGINEGASPVKYACAEGAGEPALADGKVTPARPEVLPRIVSPTEIPAGAQIVK